MNLTRKSKKNVNKRYSKKLNRKSSKKYNRKSSKKYNRKSSKKYNRNKIKVIYGGVTNDEAAMKNLQNKLGNGEKLSPIENGLLIDWYKVKREVEKEMAHIKAIKAESIRNEHDGMDRPVDIKKDLYNRKIDETNNRKIDERNNDIE